MMPTLTYLGLSDREKKQRLETQAAPKSRKNPHGLDPPEKRGQPPKYHADRDDTPQDWEEKKELTKEWLAGKRKEIAAGIDAVDKMMTFKDAEDPQGKKIIKFPKGKPVVLDKTHPLVEKLRLMSVGVDQPKKATTHAVIPHECFTYDPKPEKAPRAAAPKA